MGRFLENFDCFVGRLLPLGLTDAAVLRVRSLAHLVSLERDRIAVLGVERVALVFVARGATKFVARTATGRKQVVGFHFAGDLLTLPTTGAHHYDLHALVDSELIVLPYLPFREFAASQPQVLAALLDACEASLGRSRDKTVTLGRKTAPERVADFLLAMAPRIGTVQNGAILLDLPMSRRDIADSIGLALETVSRQFTQLRDDGVIETWGRARVRLLDRTELEARSGRLRQLA